MSRPATRSPLPFSPAVIAMTLVVLLPQLATAQDDLGAYAKTFPAMPRGVADLLPFVDSPRDLTFGSGTPFNDLVYTAFVTGYMDGETDGFDTFYPVDPAAETPGADAVRYVRTTGNVDLDNAYSGPVGDRILLGDDGSDLPFFRRGANGEDDDYLVIQNLDYRHGAIELPGDRRDYRLLFGEEDDGYATTGYYLFYLPQADPGAAPDLIAFVFACDDLGVSVSGAPARNPRAMCNDTGVLSLSDAEQFRFSGDGDAGGDAAVLPEGLRQFGTRGKEIVGGIAADDDGNVYAFGSSDASLATGAYLDHAIWIARTDGDGGAGWVTEIKISDGSLLFDGVADDEFLYVAGRTLGALPGFTNGGRWDAILLKLRLSDGAIVATDQWGNANLDGYGSICLDDAGHLYVTGAGSPAGETSTDPDHLVAKHRAADLSNVWRVLDTPAAEVAFVSEAWGGVSYHPGEAPGEGTVAAGGWYMSQGGSEAFASLWTDLAAASPTRKAATTLGSDGVEADWFLDNAFDAEGNVYFVGYTTGGVAGANAGQGDALVVKYDADLANPTMRRFGTGQSDQFRRVSIAPDGTLYAVGYTYGDLGGDNADGSGRSGRSGDVLVARLTPDLEPLASARFGAGGEERGYIALRGERLFVGGLTDGAVVGPSAGSYDVWLAEINPDDLTVRPRATDIAEAPRFRPGLAVDFYPNPTDGELTVALCHDPNARATAVVVDARGSVVERLRLVDASTQLRLPDTPGLYLIVVEDERGGRVAQRVLRR